MRNEKAIFHITLGDINDFSACGVTKIVNTRTVRCRTRGGPTTARYKYNRPLSRK